MSQTPSTSASCEDYFGNPFKIYNKKTGKDLREHPLRLRLESCRTPDAVLTALGEEFEQSRSKDKRLTRWLDPTVNVLWRFSEAVDGAVNLTPSPTVMVFAGIGVLLPLAVSANTGQDALTDLFEVIEGFLRRLETFVEPPLTKEMTDTIIKCIAELLIILAIATWEKKSGKIIKQMKKCTKRLARRVDIEDALWGLDGLVPEDGWMATAHVPKATYGVGKGVEVVDDDLNDRVGCRVSDADEGPALDDGERAAEQTQQIPKEVSKLHRIQSLEDIRRWLCPPDLFKNFNRARDERHQGTALWFMRSSTFKDWKASGSLLWIHGKSGSGKSVLTSAIIQAIKDDISVKDDTPHTPPVCMAHFFFDFRDARTQNTRALLSSLIVQLGDQSDSFHDILFAFHSTHDSTSQQPNDGELLQCLKDMLSHQEKKFAT